MSPRPILATTALALLLTACGAGEADDLPEASVIELNNLFDADFALTDHTGTPATDERFEGKPMLIYFGFTSCPDICPAALGTMTATLDKMGDEAEEIQPLFITVDPKRDDAARLAEHLSYDERILGLTGDEAALKSARDNLNVYAAEMPLPDSEMGYTVDHQRLFYLTNADGVAVYAFPDTLAPEKVAKLAREQL